MHNDNNNPAIIPILIIATILLFRIFFHSKNILKMVVDMLVYSSQLRSKCSFFWTLESSISIFAFLSVAFGHSTNWPAHSDDCKPITDHFLSHSSC